MTLFDSYVAVDWSASATRKIGKNSIWVGAARAGAEPAVENHPTRASATSALRSMLRDRADAGARVLVGFDFAFGYPAGFADALGLEGAGPAWRRAWDLMADLVHDDDRNRNDRFSTAALLNERLGRAPGPFWGVPPRLASSSLTSKRAPFEFDSFQEYRHTERCIRARGHRVWPAWQLLGAGCVGSQTVTGLPRVASLRDDAVIGAVTRVWPMETGFTLTPTTDARVVLAEVWPGLATLDLSRHPVRDACQVLALVEEWRAADERGVLDERFAPQDVDDQARRAALTEEGWILGA